MAKSRLTALIITGIAAIFSLQAQVTVASKSLSATESDSIKTESIFNRYGILNKLEVGMTLGTTGIGFEAASSLTEWAKVRIGLSFVPQIDIPMSFGLTTYSDNSIISNKFDDIKDLMYQLSGYEMNNTIDINSTPKMVNFKFLVDVYPLKNKHWHLTLGFYTGPKCVAKAINTMTEMPSLLAVGMYNRLYDYTLNDGFIDNPIYNDIYLDPEQADKLKEKLESYGRLGIHIGDFKDGSPYYMEPGKDGTVNAKAYVNTFRYYAGFGYGGALSGDKRWNISVDAGAMFWGGSPKVITHDGVDMADELINVRGKVGDYLRMMKSLKVYPVLEMKLSYTFF